MKLNLISINLKEIKQCGVELSLGGPRRTCLGNGAGGLGRISVLWSSCEWSAAEAWLVASRSSTFCQFRTHKHFWWFLLASGLRLPRTHRSWCLLRRPCPRQCGRAGRNDLRCRLELQVLAGARGNLYSSGACSRQRRLPTAQRGACDHTYLRASSWL